MSAPVKRIAWAPEWASAWGEDEHGLFAEFTYAGVVQRMRLIPPGKFMMGDEGQHEVQHTEDYWLADTACTQELWVAVMGKNPSRFTEREEGEACRPVDSVSWEDCDGFLQQLNQQVPGLELRLPTEAEWEYACRAGTLTAYSFGDNVTKKQVNYDSSQTVPVKSLPANPWGLYEMHGNLWEWCWDWVAPYETGPAVDPVCRKKAGGARVLRGGSWRFDARGARSAYRDGFLPGVRFENLGFRLARGRPVQQDQPAGAEGARGPGVASGAQPTKGPRATGAGGGGKQ